jgi:hypothetical protein
MALIDRKADIDARRDAGAKPGHAAKNLAAIADEIGDRVVSRRNAVALEPGAKLRRFGSFRRAAAAGIGPRHAAEPVARLVAEPLQEIAAEIGHGRACGDVGIDHGRRRRRRRAGRWRRSRAGGWGWCGGLRVSGGDHAEREQKRQRNQPCKEAAAASLPCARNRQ